MNAPHQDPAPLPTATRSAITAINYAFLLIALVAALIFARIIVISALIGLGIGVILAPAFKLYQRRYQIPRAVSAAVLIVIGIALFGGIGYGIFAIGESQFASLSQRMPELIGSLQARMNGLVQTYPWLGGISEGKSSFDVAGTAKAVGTNLFKGAWSGFAVIGALVFSFIIGLYTAVEADSYFRALIEAFPRHRRAAAASFLQDSAATIRNWFNAQLIDMAIIGLLTSIGLWAVGADYWLLYGILTGLLGVIPYAGIAIVIVFASLVTLASEPSRLPWVLGVFLITQQLEGHLVLPLVMRGRAQLPAVPLLIFMLILGSWGGLLGVLMAPALFAVLLVAYRTLYLPSLKDCELGSANANAPPSQAPAPPAPPAPPAMGAPAAATVRRIRPSLGG